MYSTGTHTYTLLHARFSFVYNDDEFNNKTAPCSYEYFSYTVRCSSTVYVRVGNQDSIRRVPAVPSSCMPLYSTVAVCLAWFQDEGAEMERHYCDTVPPVQLTVYLGRQNIIYYNSKIIYITIKNNYTQIIYFSAPLKINSSAAESCGSLAKLPSRSSCRRRPRWP